MLHLDVSGDFSGIRRRCAFWPATLLLVIDRRRLEINSEISIDDSDHVLYEVQVALI